MPTPLVKLGPRQGDLFRFATAQLTAQYPDQTSRAWVRTSVLGLPANRSERRPAGFPLMEFYRPTRRECALLDYVVALPEWTR